MTNSNSWYRKEYLLGLGGLGGGAGGVLIAGGPIATSGDAYQIYKGLRYNKPDAPRLTRTTGTGDRRTFTIAAWIKQSALDYHTIFGYYGSGQFGGCRLMIDNTGSLRFQEREDNGNYTNCDIRTTALLRDYSAWMHIVCAVDTTRPANTDRVKIYLNGVRQTSFATSTWPAQHYALHINDSSLTAGVGSWYEDSTHYPSDAYLADVHFIDGLALSPGAFGTFSSGGVFNPKIFALPTPNQGVTHSSTLVPTINGSTASFNSGNGAAMAFNGTASDGVQNWANVLSTGAGQVVKMTYTPATAISAPTTLRMHTYTGDSGDAIFVTFNGNGRTRSLADLGYSTGQSQWVDVSEILPKGEDITEICVDRTSNGSGDGSPIGAIEVDGVILVDGQTDKTYAEWKAARVNNGKDWADGASPASGTSTLWCDGSMGQGWLYDTTYDKFTNHDIVVGSTLKFWHNGGGTSTKIKDGDGNIYQLSSGGNTWVTMQNGDSQSGVPFTGTLNGPVYIAQPSGGSSYLQGVKVDEELLIRTYNAQAGGNSFHFRFNDTSTNSAVGKDSLHGKIEDATGGLPIYNTTDDYGDVKGSGYAADSSAGTTNDTGLVLAIPGDVLTDVHHNINTGSSQKTVTNDTGDAAGSITVKTDESRLYGSSMYFNGTGNANLTLPNDADFAFGTGDFCVECWVRHFQLGGLEIYYTDVGGDSAGIFLAKDTDNKVYVYYSSTILKGATVLKANNWYHVAYVRNSGVSKIYLNGVEDASVSDTANLTTTEYSIGNAYSSNIGPFKGWMNDFRVYKGVAKYTAAFKPPTRNDFTVTNIGGGVKNYTSMWSGTGPVSGNNGGVFVGDSTTTHGDHGSGGTGTYIVWTPSPAITINSSARVYMTQGSASQCTINGTSFTTTNNAWNDITSHCNGTLSTFRLDAGAGSAWAKVWQVEIDGEILKDTDLLTDSPVNSGTDAGVGGEVTGNFCTLNVNDSGGNIFAEGGLEISHNAGNWKGARGTWGITSGKWYFEGTLRGQAPDGSNGYYIGAGTQDASLTGVLASQQYQRQSSIRWSHDTNTSFYSTSVVNDVHGVAIDMDNKKMWISDNNTWQGSGNPATGANAHFTIVHDEVFPLFHIYGSTIKLDLNFGASPFKYTAPTGFKSLCTANLDNIFDGEDTENNPSKYFDVLTYKGDSVDGRVLGGLGFKPDMSWFKNRSSNTWHLLYDAIRGTGSSIFPNSNAAAGSDAHITAFNDDGVTMQHVDSGTINADGSLYVGWFWDAGTSASGANTNGSVNIASGDQWVNDTAGFSITKWAGNDTNPYTVGHGLSAKPDFMIIKRYTTGSSGWFAYHSSVGATKYLQLDSSGAMGDDAGFMNDTEPSSTVFTLGNWNGWDSGQSLVAYSWRSIPGYSKFGSYEASGASGKFLYFGFKPALVIFKAVDASGSWNIRDNKRDKLNPNEAHLIAEGDAAETTQEDIDFVSNGVVIRSTDGGYNNSNTFLYMAWAENPFKTARAH